MISSTLTVLVSFISSSVYWIYDSRSANRWLAAEDLADTALGTTIFGSNFLTTDAFSFSAGKVLLLRTLLAITFLSWSSELIFLIYSINASF